MTPQQTLESLGLLGMPWDEAVPIIEARQDELWRKSAVMTAEWAALQKARRELKEELDDLVAARAYLIQEVRPPQPGDVKVAWRTA